MFWRRWRLVVIGLWVIVVALAAPRALHVTHGLSGSGFEDPRSLAVWADQQLNRLPHSAGGAGSTLVEGLPAADVQAAWSAAATANGIPDSAGAVASLPGHARDVMVDVLPSAGPAGDQAAQQMRQQLSQGPGVTVRSVGLGSAGDGVLNSAMTTLQRAGAVALPIMAVLLLLVYDSAVAAVLPLVVAVVGAVVALAVIDLLEPYMQLSVYLTNIVSFLALGVGIDYSLFLSARFRSALRGGQAVSAALDEAMRTSGRSVFFAAVAVGSSMLALLLPRTSYWSGLAVGGCVAVFAVLAATLTLLPALLAVLGTQSERGRIPRPNGMGRFWPWAAGAIGRRPALVLGLSVLVLGLPALAARGIAVRTPANVATLLAPGDVLRLAVERQQQDYGPGSIAPLPIALVSPTPLADPRTWQVVADLTARLSALPAVARVDSPVGPGTPPEMLAAAFAAPGGPPPALRSATAAPDLIALSVTSRYGLDDPRTTALLDAVQGILAQDLPTGWHGGVGGAVALLAAFNALVARTLPLMVGVVALIALVVLFIASGSLWVSVLAVAFDGLVALSTAGLLVWLVQHGRIGFEPLPLDASITPLIFVVLFGLSMDYEVILIHRIREYAATGLGPSAAAQRGLSETGGMITGAGMLMIVAFAVMWLSPLQLMRTMALGMSAAILLDTWVVRTCMVPTSLMLLGRGAWWPFGLAGAQGRRSVEQAAAD